MQYICYSCLSWKTTNMIETKQESTGEGLVYSKRNYSKPPCRGNIIKLLSKNNYIEKQDQESLE